MAPSALFASVAPQFVKFRSLCVYAYVQFSEIEPINYKLINDLAFHSMKRMLADAGLNFPIDTGQECFPGMSKANDRSLGLWFNVTIARAPSFPPLIALSIAPHTSYKETMPWYWPTRIHFCHGDGDRLPECIADQLSRYFQEHAVKAFLATEEGRQLDIRYEENSRKRELERERRRLDYERRQPRAE